MNNEKRLDGIATMDSCDLEGVKIINQAFGVDFKNLTFVQQLWTESYLNAFRNKDYEEIHICLKRLENLGLIEKIKYSEKVFPKFYYDDPEGVKTINQAFDVEWKDLTLDQQILTKDHYLKGLREKNFFAVSFAVEQLKKLGLTEKTKNLRPIAPALYYLNSEEIQNIKKNLNVDYDELDMCGKMYARLYLDFVKVKNFEQANFFKSKLESYQ